jgi:hypothetical protein
VDMSVPPSGFTSAPIFPGQIPIISGYPASGPDACVIKICLL